MRRRAPGTGEIMRIKSYFARAVEDAITQARQEMGEDAMLIKTRRASAETGHQGDYEVIFAVDVPSGDEACAVPAPERSAAPPDRLAVDLAEMRRELEGMRRALARSAFAPAQRPGMGADAAAAYAALIAAEVNPDLARELVESAEMRATQHTAAEKKGAAPDGRLFRTALAAEIADRVAVGEEPGQRGGRPRIVALVGPPGAGKTSTLVKLAVRYGLASRRPAIFLSADTHRIAAAEQLRAYAAILGIGCQVLETVTGLSQAIEEHAAKDLVLIDTPGLGAAELEAAAPLAAFLSGRPDIETHLVLPASMRSVDVARAAAAYAAFGPTKLLFTRLDETACFGSILNEAARSGRPISFFTAGQRIPEDLEPATHRRVAELVLGASPENLDAEACTAAA